MTQPLRTASLAFGSAVIAATVLTAWLSAGGAAQAPGKPGQGLLMGVVVDPLGKRPVAGAQVTLGGTVTGVTNPQVLTDGEGRFVFLGLPKGIYTITASKAGYADGALGRRRPNGPAQSVTLAEAERIGDLSLPIWKFAAITGTVRDEAGEPMVALPVRVLRRSMLAGRRKLWPGAIVRTDDRGMYRFGSLVPGDYVVAVPSTQAVAPESVVDLYRARLTGPPPPGSQDVIRDLSFSGGSDVPNWISRNSASTVGDLAYVALSGDMRAGLAPPGGGRLFVYPTQFHPAALTAAQAATITVQPGEERLGIDLHMKLVPAVRITGTVTGPSGPLITVMTLTPDTDDYATDESLETATTLSDAAGRFTFIGVPPGQYRLRAMRVEVPPSGAGSRAGGPPPTARPAPAGPTPTPAPVLGGYTLSATESIAVGSSDIDNLAITVRYGFRVSGRAEFPKASAPVDPAMIRRMAITLDPADGRPLVTSTIGRALFNEKGEFSSYQAPPGRYYLRVNNPPPGWTLKRATWNSHDVSNVPLTLDRDAGGIIVEFTDRPSTLSGQVQNAAGVPDATATVLVFPADAGIWTDYGDFPRRLRALRADKEGRYHTVGLPAGDYLVVAVVDESTTNWQDPATLKTLSRLATAIALADDETRSLALRTTAVSR